MKQKLSPEQKVRVGIAKDALKHLAAKRIEIKGGKVLYFLPSFVKQGSLQKVFKSVAKAKKKCTVCARGALFFAHVWKNNQFECTPDINDQKGTVNDMNSGTYGNNTSGGIQPVLEKFFTRIQLALIESAFEGKYNSEMFTNEQKDVIIKFHNKYKTERTRLKAILNNIIKNNGEFIP